MNLEEVKTILNEYPDYIVAFSDEMFIRLFPNLNNWHIKYRIYRNFSIKDNDKFIFELSMNLFKHSAQTYNICDMEKVLKKDKALRNFK